MALDYKKIREDKIKEYGTKVGNIGNILAKLYSDRTHFIFELLQNAEDALKNRGAKWQGKRSVSFELTRDHLRVSHFGRPFDEDDVRGICEIGESTKSDDLTAIGKFGIGFKSVYAVTDRPKVHSGPEDFAISNYVRPEATSSIKKDPDETVFVFPLISDDGSAYSDIAAGLGRLGDSSLLFLHQISGIQWIIDDGRAGSYRRQSKHLGEGVRRVSISVDVLDGKNTKTEWLVFGCPVPNNLPAGNIEIAFSLDLEHERLEPVDNSRLVVFFPTAFDTHLGFLIQGPYKTTPSRDNVPQDDPWNKSLIHETANLLQDALRWLRDKNYLNTDVLGCLPLDSQRFDRRNDPLSYLNSDSGTESELDANMLAPLFAATKRTLMSEPLLPTLDGGYVSAENSLLGRGEAVRALLSTDQLSALYGKDMMWLSRDITQDSAPKVRHYLINELGVEEITPESIIRKLDHTFLKNQPDNWIMSLYKFLNGQPALTRPLSNMRRPIDNVPLIRLEDGSHVTPKSNVNGEPQAFLPGEDKTDFPTVHPAVCVSNDAQSFLRSLGIREPDLVDDVIMNVLPKYQEETFPDDEEYAMDIERIIRAFPTDSSLQREKLLNGLRDSQFISAVDSGTDKKFWCKPGSVYLATDPLKELFDRIEGVYIVDDSYESLRDADVGKLLDECGVVGYLKPESFTPYFSYEELWDMRKKAGYDPSENTETIKLKDWKLKGLDKLLDSLPELDSELRKRKPQLLWDALVELEERQGSVVFSGHYTWRYFRPRSTTFDANFVRKLNESEWIPNIDGDLERPESVIFDNLGWQNNDFLQSKIRFKQPIMPKIAELANAIDVDPEAVAMLRKHGITADKLIEMIGIPGEVSATTTIAGNEATLNGDSQDTTDQDSGASPSEIAPTEAGGREPFAKKFFGSSSIPTPTESLPVLLADDGPLTEQSASKDTETSDRIGQTGRHVRRPRTRWEPTEAAKDLADKFRAMVKGDYGKRCQVCGTTFRMPNGELHTSVVHVVEPSSDKRTNHYGDLVEFCGSHYSLVRYGQWTWLNPETRKPIIDADDAEAWEQFRDLVLGATEKIDDDGNKYIGLPIRFSNIYQNWNSDPVEVNEVVRYSKPHWVYLCELLKA